MRILRTLSVVGAAAALAAGATSTAHAQVAADPETAYNVSYGNSYFKGSLIWYTARSR
ncbi:hypothetical protein ACIBJC_24280 [Streptomyces sp. NPDC050509]|uniref:hypothetical protein n=1 Tax=Streptomyces sp. NPDC050509 TaxID=3365620 RepID=UPI00379D16C6